MSSGLIRVAVACLIVAAIAARPGSAYAQQTPAVPPSAQTPASPAPAPAPSAPPAATPAQAPERRAGPLALPHFHQQARSPAGHTFYETPHRKTRKRR